jgi:hypothetical protein
MVGRAVAPVSLTFPREAAEAMILNKYVDFGQVCQHNPAYVAVTAVSVEDALDVLKPSPWTPIKSAHALLVLYEKIVKLTLRLQFCLDGSPLITTQ